MPCFAVSAGHARTAEAAGEVLRAGGTAVDACIAGALMACVAEPVLAGLFGGGFLMLREPGGRAQCLDFFVQTPKRRRPEGEWDLREVDADFGEARQTFHIGAASIAVPGVPTGLAAAHERYGRAPLPELAAAAVSAAARGLPLSNFQARVLEVVAPIYRATPSARAIYCPEDDRLAEAGSMLANASLADALDIWSREGPRFAREGELATALAAMAEAGGHLTLEDLRGYRTEWRTPLERRRSGVRLAMNPPPSLGGTLVGFALELLQHRPEAVALARAFAATAEARRSAGPEAAVGLLSPESLTRWRGLLDRPAALRGTTHVSAVDASGMVAALTLSNGEGCGSVVPGTGIMPNNMLGELDLLPEGLDRWQPDVRLASMMCPTIMDWPDGRIASLGSGGSNRIRSAMAGVLVRLADRGEALDVAIGAPRLHAEMGPEPGAPATVDFEDRLPDHERAALIAAFPEARGWARDSLFFGGVHAVRRGPSGAVEAAADARREGVALIG